MRLQITAHRCTGRNPGVSAHARGRAVPQVRPAVARHLPFWSVTRGLRVPLGYADAHYRLRMHVDLVRLRVQEMAQTASAQPAAR